MNKNKFIPVLAVVALLSACGVKNNKSESVKTPKFEKLGSEVEKEEFVNDFSTGLNGLAFKDSKLMGSKEGTYYYGYESDLTVKRDGKEIAGNNYKEITDEKFQMDAVACISNYTGTYKEISEQFSTLSGSKSKNVNGEKWDNAYQQVVYDNQNMYAYVDSLTKVVSLYGSVEDSQDLKLWHDYIAKGSLYYESGYDKVSGEFDYVSGMSEEDVTNYGYAFYKNGNMLSLTCNPEDGVYESRVDGLEEGELISSTKIEYSETFQITFTGENMKVVYHSEETNTTTYSLDQGNYRAGDVEVQKYIYSYMAEFKDANLNLKPINVEGFNFIN